MRETIAGIAIAGALLATVGGSIGKRRQRVRRWVIYAGYGLCGVSVVLFIVAGFRQGYL